MDVSVQPHAGWGEESLGTPSSTMSRNDAQARCSEQVEEEDGDLDEYIRLLDDWYNAPRGRDVPDGLLNTKCNQDTRCLIVAHHVSEDHASNNFWSANRKDSHVWLVEDGYTVKYEHSSNNPKLVISCGNMEMRLTAENLEELGFASHKSIEARTAASTSKVETFDVPEYLLGSLALFKADFDRRYAMSNMTSDVFEAISTFILAENCEHGVTVTALRMSRNTGYWNNAHPLATRLKENRPMMLVIRRKRECFPHADTWFNKSLIENQHTIYNRYVAQRDEDEGWLPFLEDPATLTLPIHMRMLTFKSGVCSNPAIYRFHSKAEYAAKMTLAVVQEFAYTQKQHGTPFGKDKIHDARIVSIDDKGYVEALLQNNLGEDQILPNFDQSTRVTIVLRQPLSKTETCYLKNSNDGVNTKMSFHLATRYRSKIRIGQGLRCSLLIDTNKIVPVRHLKAIQRLSMSIEPVEEDVLMTSHDKKQDIFTTSHDVKQAILCSGATLWENHHVPADYFQEAYKLQATKAYTESRNLDAKQTKVLDVTLHEVELVTLVQGSSDDRTETIATLVTAVSLLDKNVIACAPTNAATKKMLRHIVEQWRIAKARFPEAAKYTNVVYFETIPVLKERLFAPLAQEDKEVYSFINHFVELMKRDVRKEPATQRSAPAQKWLRIRQDVDKGVDLDTHFTKKELAFFVKHFTDNWERIFYGGQMTVVSTCNNSYTLTSKCFEFNGYLVVVDDSTTAIEADVIIPIAWHAQRVVLFGDLGQRRPILFSSNANTEFEQLRLSLFERLMKAGKRRINLDTE